MSEEQARSQWKADRTTFQRIYDVLAGTRTFSTAASYAERADCSETAARNALEQLAEMGIAARRDGRPAGYRRNESYFRWKRIESLAREHSREELHQRIEDLVAEDEAFQTAYGVPEPAAVSTTDLPPDDHDAVQERWEEVSNWRTVRRDIRDLRRAVERAETRADDGVFA